MAGLGETAVWGVGAASEADAGGSTAANKIDSASRSFSGGVGSSARAGRRGTAGWTTEPMAERPRRLGVAHRDAAGGGHRQPRSVRGRTPRREEDVDAGRSRAP